MKGPLGGLPPANAWLRGAPFLQNSTNTDAITLTDRQRSQLAHIGTRLRVPARTVVYEQESPAQWVYAIVEGAVKTYRELPSGKRAVTAFLFARDLFGLAENGRYVNMAQTLVLSTLYKLPIRELAALLRQDGDLQFKFLLKVTHELRESQRRAILVNRRDAPGRLAMFIGMMAERTDSASRSSTIALPMTRSDIAGYLGLSPESVSRAIAALERRGVAVFDGRHDVRIADPGGLVRLAAAV
jgi:CRP/FNR family transcriptional regulator